MSALQHIKTPMVFGLNTFAERKVADAIQQSGKSLPCTVAKVLSSGIVTVNFEVNAAPWTLPQVTIPILYPEYIRYPIQVGDKGACVAFDARLGGLSGLGSGTPNMSAPGNLTALAFDFLGSSAWSATDDPQSVVIYGPNGVIIRTTAKNVVLQVGSGDANLTGSLNVTQNVTVGTGADGAFTSVEGLVITVQSGIVTNIN